MNSDKWTEIRTQLESFNYVRTVDKKQIIQVCDQILRRKELQERDRKSLVIQLGRLMKNCSNQPLKTKIETFIHELEKKPPPAANLQDQEVFKDNLALLFQCQQNIDLSQPQNQVAKFDQTKRYSIEDLEIENLTLSQLNKHWQLMYLYLLEEQDSADLYKLKLAENVAQHQIITEDFQKNLQRIFELETAVTDYRSQCNNLLVQNDFLTDNVADTLAQKEKAENKLLKQEQKYELLVGIHDKGKTQLLETQSKLSAKTEEIMKLMKELSTSKCQALEIAASNIKIQSQLNDKTTRHEQQMTVMQKLEEQNYQLSQQINSLLEQSDEMKRNNIDCQQTIDHLHQQVEEHVIQSQKQTQLQNDNKTIIVQLQEKLRNVESENQYISSELNRQEQDKLELEKQYSFLLDNYRKQQEELNNSHETNIIIRNHNSELECQLKDCVILTQTLQNQLNVLQQEYQIISYKNNDLNDQFKQLQVIHQNTELQLDLSQKTKQQLGKNLQKVNIEMQEVKQSLKTTSDILSELRDSYSAKQLTLLQKATEIENMNIKVYQLKQSLSEQTQKYEQSQLDLFNLQEHHHQLLQLLSQCRSQHENVLLLLQFYDELINNILSVYDENLTQINNEYDDFLLKSHQLTKQLYNQLSLIYEQLKIEQSENKLFQQQISDYVIVMSDQQHQIVILMQQIKDYCEEKQCLVDSINTSNDKLILQQSVSQQKSENIRNLAQIITQLENRNSQLSNTLEIQSQQISEQNCFIQKQEEQRILQVDQYKSMLQEKELFTNDCQNNFTILQTQFVSLQNEQGKLKSDYLQQSELLQTLQMKIIHYQQQLDELHEIKDNLNNSVKMLQNQLEDKDIRISDGIVVLEGLQLQLLSCSQTNDAKQATILQLNDQLTLLKFENKNLNNQLLETQQQLEIQKLLQQSFVDKYNDLQQQNTLQAGQISNLQNDISASKLQIQEQEQQLSDKLEQIIALNLNMGEIDQTNNELRKQLRESSIQQAIKSQNILDLQILLKETELLKEKYRVNLELIQMQNEDLNAHLIQQKQVYQTNINKLQQQLQLQVKEMKLVLLSFRRIAEAIKNLRDQLRQLCCDDSYQNILLQIGNKVQELDDNVRQVIINNEALSNSNTQMQEEIELANKRNNELILANTHINDELQSSQQQLQQSQLNHQSYVNQQLVHTDQIEQLLRDNKIQIQQLEEQKYDLNNKYQEEKTEKQKAYAQVVTLQDGNKAVQQDLTQLRLENREKQIECLDQLKDIQQLRLLLETSNDNLQSAQSQLQDSNNQLKTKTIDFQTNANKLLLANEQLHELTDELCSAKNEITDLQQKLNNKQDQLNQNLNELTDLQLDFQKINTDNNDLLHKYKKLQEKYDQLLSQSSDLENQLKTERNSNLLLNKQLDQALSDKDDALALQDIYQRASEKHKIQMEEMRNKLNDKEKENDEMQFKNIKVEKQYEREKENVQQYKDQINDQREKIQLLEAEIAQHKNKINTLNLSKYGAE